MNLIDKLDINQKKLSTNEISLLNYFLKNSEKINQKKIKDIANETFNSTAYIVRFCQKLGFSGYSEFKNFLVFHIQIEMKEIRSLLKVKVIFLLMLWIHKI